VLPEPVAKRPPSFCTGCPERPVFSALKILRQREPEIGDTHVAADIGCSTFSTQAPFNVGNSVLGYGMARVVERGLAALRQAHDLRDGRRRLLAQRPDQRRRERDVQPPGLGPGDPRQFLRGGDRPAPRALDGKTARNERLSMTIPDALRGPRREWIRTVNSYRIAEVIGTMREALTTRVPGLKVVIAKNECMLELQRRERPRLRREAAAGRQCRPAALRRGTPTCARATTPACA